MFNIGMRRLPKACFLLFACLGIAGAEEQSMKMYNNQNIGEVTLSKQTMFADARGIGTTYYISVPKDAHYCISTVTNGVEGKEYNVTVDGNSFVEGKITLGNGWQSGLIVDGTSIGAVKTIHLSKGNHTVSFSGKGPEVPFIERIRIAEKESDARLSAVDLIAWTKTLSAKTLPADYVAKKATGLTALAAAAYTPGPQDPPKYQYFGQTNLSITTTTCQETYLTAGATATFETSGSTVDPVMYVFSKNSPSKYSWSNDDRAAGNIESKISFTVPKSDNYLVVLRSYTSGQTGSTTIKYNGSTWLSGAAIGGTFVYLSYPAVSGVTNYFTCKPGEGVYTTDTRLFTVSGWTSPANGYNDDYASQGGDFVWGYWSRIKLTNLDATYCLVSRFSGTGTATCDLYAKLPFSNLPSQIPVPGLKADDAMKSSDASGDYNCFAWTGGITSSIVVPFQPLSPWCVDGDRIASFDRYYGNNPPRYIGAPNYVRVDPSTPGIMIEVLGNSSHGQISNPGNNEMHGYDWESRFSSGTDRIFHPRSGLYGYYGSPYISYKPSGTSSASAQGQIVAENGVTLSAKATALGITGPLSFDSSVALGLTVMRNASFTDEEKNKIAALTDRIPVSLKKEFSSRMGRWQKKWSDSKFALLADPRDSMRSEEYTPLKNLCDSTGEAVWPLLFDKAQENLPYFSVLLEDVVLKSAKSEMSAVNLELGGSQFTADGAYIYTTNKDRWVTLCKKLLMNRF